MGEQDDVDMILDAIAGRGDLDLDGAAELVLGLGPDHPMRARMAVGVLTARLTAGSIGDQIGRTRGTGQTERLLAIVDQDPPADPRWRVIRSVTRTSILMNAVAGQRVADPAAAFAELEVLAEDARTEPRALMLIDCVRMLLSYQAGLSRGDHSAHERMRQDLASLRGAAAATVPEVALHFDVASEYLGILASAPESEDALATADRLASVVSRLPPGDAARVAGENMLTAVAAASGRVSSSAPGVDPEDLLDRPDLDDVQRANLLLAAGGAAFRGWQETDVDKVTAGIERFRGALALAPPGAPRQALHLASLALGLLRRNELTNNLADLTEAADVLRKAKTAAGGPADPSWQLINEMLARVGARLGDPAAKDAALDGLRSKAWNVLVEGDPSAARLKARDAAADAVAAARECLREADPAAAMRALDGGRALLLFAATELRDVGPRLVAAGRSDLAERWRRVESRDGVDAPPTDLRYEILAALSEQSGLLDPPSLADVQEALGVLDADALVYLVPGQVAPEAGGVPGWAAIAPAAGAPAVLVLPGLAAAEDRDVGRYLSALTSRDLTPVAPRPDLAGSLDAVCDWAWRSAMGPLVERYLPSLPEPPAGRPRRIILVPMGELALVPWPAARRADGVRAVELVAVSQAASARMLCRSAQATPVPQTPVGLVVGDPDTGSPGDHLPAARVEAYAVHQAFYRGGRYLGTRADGTVSPAGAGTADQVRDWLTATRPGAGTVLHLACHGVVETDGPRPAARLLLAGGGHLTAEEIIGLTPDPADRSIGLVVLAACHTGRSVAGYDEAFSLGTAFLAGGARSVLSTHWAVPDEATSVLMFMFHHFLTVGRRPVWAALREAQLWMLDGDREVPPTMPSALRRRLDGTDPAQTDAWAGFVHLGQ